MINVSGKYTDAIIYASDVEQSAIDQTKLMCDQPFMENSKVRIMPDVHSGKGSVVGFTATLGDTICPNLIGNDIACGVIVISLGKLIMDLPKFDSQVKRSIPSGAGVYHNNALYTFDYSRLRFSHSSKEHNKWDRSIGTLGSGNHFIELNKDEENNIYLVIHSGSRNLGEQVCSYYQDLAIKNYRNSFEEVQAIIQKCKEENRHKDIEQTLRDWHKSKPIVPPQLCYLTGKDKEDYLNDVQICQEYATLNRWAMANEILKHYFYPMSVSLSTTLKFKVKEKGFKVSTEGFETVHNYIDFNSGVMRKGAISAQMSEKVIIPINMRDGSIIAIGKGNEDYNFSAPHGAGRIMSRTQAFNELNMEEYKHSMVNVYSTTVSEGTLDEAPMAYKPISSILDNVKDTIDIVAIVKPIYNFKAVTDKNRKWK